jgi:hypothetical protein
MPDMVTLACGHSAEPVLLPAFRLRGRWWREQVRVCRVCGLFWRTVFVEVKEP